jgi:hypothetical protein
MKLSSLIFSFFLFNGLLMAQTKTIATINGEKINYTPINGTGLIKANGTTISYDNTPYAPLASPALTGNPTATTATAGDNDTTIATTAFVTAAVNAATPSASETVSGKVELATAAETTTGTDNTRAVHPAGLKVELNKKENTITPGTNANYYRGDKTWQTLNRTAVGLNNVDNTSDANKPVSTATQTALNAKADKTSGASQITDPNAYASIGTNTGATQADINLKLNEIASKVNDMFREVNTPPVANFNTPNDQGGENPYEPNGANRNGLNIFNGNYVGTVSLPNTNTTNGWCGFVRSSDWGVTILNTRTTMTANINMAANTTYWFKWSAVSGNWIYWGTN